MTLLKTPPASSTEQCQVGDAVSAMDGDGEWDRGATIASISADGTTMGVTWHAGGVETVSASRVIKSGAAATCARAVELSNQACDFGLTPNAAIHGYDNEHMVGTVDECKAACCSKPWCVSFDYDKRVSECDLSSANVFQANGLKTDYSNDPYDFYFMNGQPLPSPHSHNNGPKNM